MRSFDNKEASDYLSANHGLQFSPVVLSAYAENRKQSGMDWGPTPNSDGRYSADSLDGFADGIKRARREQEGRAVA